MTNAGRLPVLHVELSTVVTPSAERVPVHFGSSSVNGVSVRSRARPLPVWLALVLLLISASGPAVAAVIVCATDSVVFGRY